VSTLQFQPATYDAFLALAQEATVVPVAVTLPADVHTPVGVFLKVAGQSGDVGLFENQRLERHLPPYTLIGLDPRWIIIGRDGRLSCVPHTPRSNARKPCCKPSGGGFGPTSSRP
jgi:anthranilate synthase component 1